MKQALQFKRDGLTIAGTLYVPDGQAPYPLVIISHGFSGNATSNIREAEWFVKQGIAAYIYDFIGGGFDIKSDGTMKDMSVLTEVADLMCVYEGLQALPIIDDSHIFLMGKSQGGFVSAYVAATLKEKIRGVILYYPAFVLQDDTKARLKTDDLYTIMGIQIGDIYNRDSIAFDIYDVIGGYKDKVLIIHGDSDEIVPLSYSKKAFDVYDEADLIVIKHAHHGYNDDEALIAFGYTLSYVIQRLD